MTNKKLFTDFSPVTAKAFKQKIQVDLKGEDYNKTLVWKSPEGIHVKPFYHRETSIAGPHLTPAHWHIGENIFILDTKVASTTAVKAISNGTEAIHFIADKAFKIEELFKPLVNKNIPLYFELRFLDNAFAKALLEKALDLNITLYLNIDLIGNLVKDGNWYHSNQKDHDILKDLLSHKGNILSIDMDHYQNAGATITQQLAYALCHVNEYFNFTEEHELPLNSVHFKVAIGSNYFFEIAKLRALRHLFQTLIGEYRTTSKTVCHITAQPSRRNKTLYDYNTNMLRTTTECMSAVLGGANTIINRPYDDIYHKTNAFGQRISRNQLLILKKESYFDAVSNPADGAYYIESLTTELATNALHIFKEIETSGGFLKQLQEGTIQRKIKESAQKEEDAFNKGDIHLLGTNIHPNPQDCMKDTIELYPFVKHKPRKTILEPIITKRLAEATEKERLESEV
jgi:methylmalonyl-CoA mutase